MAEILFINACIRTDSRTLELAHHVLAQLPGETEEVKLYEANLSPLDLQGMEARDRAARTGDFSDAAFALARQFADAETIVIAAPYWDLMFPAVMKNYLETITVSGLTFVYGENGIPQGLCKAKRLIYVTTAGGPIRQNFGYDYVAALARSFYGIGRVECVSAEGLDIHGADVQTLLAKAKSTFAPAAAE
ncbi:MAG: NAD(P)H-dependent oxidoreductase [Clostridia bacterium]|nr:NAD(P)H-dependent oxidoreductase [Clostridia bacterium]